MKQILVTVTTNAGAHQITLKSSKVPFGREIGAGGEEANVRVPRVIGKFITASKKKKGTATFTFVNCRYEIEVLSRGVKKALRTTVRVNKMGRPATKQVKFTLLKGDSFRITKACDKDGEWFTLPKTNNFSLRFDEIVPEKAAVSEDEESTDDAREIVDDSEAVENEEDKQVILGMTRGIIASVKEGVDVSDHTIGRSVDYLSAPLKHLVHKIQNEFKATDAKLQTEKKTKQDFESFRSMVLGGKK